MLNSLKPNPSCIALIITQDGQFVSQLHESTILQMLNAAQQNRALQLFYLAFII